jgi:hypothetical protein
VRFRADAVATRFAGASGSLVNRRADPIDRRRRAWRVLGFERSHFFYLITRVDFNSNADDRAFDEAIPTIESRLWNVSFRHVMRRFVACRREGKVA